VAENYVYQATPVSCEQCGTLDFRVMYDAKVGGYHVECAKCGSVFLGLR
jgi:uncharacterized Zn finger protein